MKETVYLIDGLNIWPDVPKLLDKPILISLLEVLLYVYVMLNTFSSCVFTGNHNVEG